jgi:hypothetical protein
MHRPALVTTLLTALVLTLSACGGYAEPDDQDAGADTSSSPSSSSSSAPTESGAGSDGSGSSPEKGETIEVTFADGSVTPNGERVEVGVGEEVTFVITAEAPGSLHVHGTPEQELDYDEGTTETSLTIDRPGVVEVESHDLGVVVQLEVR